MTAELLQSSLTSNSLLARLLLFFFNYYYVIINFGESPHTRVLLLALVSSWVYNSTISVQIWKWYWSSYLRLRKKANKQPRNFLKARGHVLKNLKSIPWISIWFNIINAVRDKRTKSFHPWETLNKYSINSESCSKAETGTKANSYGWLEVYDLLLVCTHRRATCFFIKY